MKKLVFSILFCIVFSVFGIAQVEPNSEMKKIQYSFDRSDALANAKDYTTYYIYFYGGTKSGWNAKTKEDYPVQDKIIYTKIFRLINLPPSYNYRPSETGNVCDKLTKQFLQFLIKTSGFNEDINYTTWIGDYDLKFVEKTIEETMTKAKKFSPPTKFLYTSKFSFQYSDNYYKTEYKAN